MDRLLSLKLADCVFEEAYVFKQTNKQQLDSVKNGKQCLTT